jgi:hypothetical protein
MNSNTKQYYVDNENGLYHITEAQTWDLKRNFGYTFEVISKEEFTKRLVGE